MTPFSFTADCGKLFGMIELTTLAGKPILLNPDTIRYCESTPDTIVCFMDGTRLPIKETLIQVKEKVLEFRRQERQASWS